MNTHLIGKKFEKEVYEVLKKKFDKVIWLSENNKVSSVDFKCIKKNIIFYVEAKKNPIGTYRDGCYDRYKINLFCSQINNEIIFLLPRDKGENKPVKERIVNIDYFIKNKIKESEK